MAHIWPQKSWWIIGFINARATEINALVKMPLEAEIRQRFCDLREEAKTAVQLQSLLD